MRPKGFAALTPEKRREIAAKGGRAAHEAGTAHEFTRDEASAAGKKGGQLAHASGRAHEFTSEEAREAGRLGGYAAQRARKQAAAAQAVEEGESR